MQSKRVAEQLTIAREAICQAENALQEGEGSKAVKTNSAGWEQQTIYLPPDLRQWLRLYAATTNQEMSAIAAEALQEYRIKQQRG